MGAGRTSSPAYPAADIDYSYKTASTIYGILGVKVWIFKGEIIPKKKLPPPFPLKHRAVNSVAVNSLKIALVKADP
jgi:ribosomal protein S3